MTYLRLCVRVLLDATKTRVENIFLIILPFHKFQRIDGVLESNSAAHQNVNNRVLHTAPCSLVVLVNRGLGGAALVSSNDVSYTMDVLFFGGPDDREALDYGMRMAEHPGISLLVIQFLKQDLADADDEESVAYFQSKKTSRSYEEVEDVGTVQVAAAIMAAGRFNLFIVGRRARLAVALVERTDCPELGPVGCYLVSPEFSKAASVLVMQRYNPKVEAEDPFGEDCAVQVYDVPASDITLEASKFYLTT